MVIGYLAYVLEWENRRSSIYLDFGVGLYLPTRIFAFTKIYFRSVMNLGGWYP